MVRVLVVDDSADDTELAVWALRRGGFKVEHLRVHSAKAMALALKTGKWDVALVDENMPGFTGAEARKLLDKHRPELPFIIFSGILTEATAANAIRAGASDLVLKDNLSRLVPALERVLQETELRREKEQTEKALHYSDTRYHQLFTMSPDAILVLEKHIVRILNAAAVRLLGASSPQEVVGRHINSLFKSIERPTLVQRLRQLLKDGASILLIEQKLVNLQGQIIDTEVALAALGDSPSDTVQMVIRDISYRRRLEREILEISHRERLRIGQDLHDGLCQVLLGIKYRGTVLHEKIRQNFPAATADCKQMVALLERAITEAQALAKGLVPVSLEAEGLACALQELAANTQSVYEVECQCNFPGRILMRDHTIAMHFYRIAQEAVSNAVKHAKPRKIEILVRHSRNHWILTINDDGRGFNPEKVHSKGMGLRTIQYRAQLLRGTLSISPRKNRGTEVRCVVPCWNRGETGVNDSRSDPSSGSVNVKCGDSRHS